MRVIPCVLLLILAIFPCRVSAQTKAESESLNNVVQLIDSGIEYLAKKEHASSISELIKARSIALRNDWHKQVFNATLNIGTNYFLMLDYGEAFHYYGMAYETAVNHLGDRQQMLVYNNVGVLYVEEGEYYKAKESFLKAYVVAKTLGDSEQTGAYAINLALVGNKLGELDYAEKLIEEALPLLKESPNIYLLGEIARTENLYLKGAYSRAEKLGLSILPRIDNLSHLNERITVNDRITVLIIMAKLYAALDRVESARDYALMARAAQFKAGERIEIYRLLSELYTRSNDYDKALAYKDSVLMATDSSYAIKNNLLFKSEKLKFQVQNYQKELSASKETLYYERRFFYVIIISIVITMGFFVRFFLNNSQKHKQNRKIMALELAKKSNEAELIRQKNKEREALELLERNRLKSALDLKNRELTTKALYLSSKNELIKEVVHAISENIQLENNAALRRQIKDLEKHLKSQNQWDRFFVHFEEVNQGFLNRLRSRHPNLTSGDIRFITFLYMNLSYKEIASLLNITPQSCRKRKERITKKLNLSGDTSLHTYLSMLQ